MGEKGFAYAAVLIKPDAFRDRIVDELIDDIVARGFKIVLQVQGRLNEAEAKAIYADLKTDLLKFETACKSICWGDVLLIVIKDTASSDACSRILAVRGKRREPGSLRYKYCPFTESDLKQLESREEILLAVGQNRLHVPDNEIAAARLISLVLKERLSTLFEQEPEIKDGLPWDEV